MIVRLKRDGVVMTLCRCSDPSSWCHASSRWFYARSFSDVISSDARLRDCATNDPRTSDARNTDGGFAADPGGPTADVHVSDAGMNAA